MIITEILAQISAPHFHAGLVLWDGKVVEAAPIIGYMKKQKWSRDRVRSYCAEKGWKVSVVYEMERSIPGSRVGADKKRHRDHLEKDALPPARACSS